MKMQSKSSSRAIILFWMAMLLFVSFFAGFVIALSIVKKSLPVNYDLATETLGREVFFDERLYGAVVDYLKQDYFKRDTLDDKKLFYGALRGVVEAVGDPYTTFFDPQSNKEFAEELNGSFEGIGAELGIRDDRLTVIAPIPGSPAETSGLLAEDVILAIDNKDTRELSLDEAVAAIRGKAGTSVVLTIYRSVQDAPAVTKDITILRSRIQLPTVSARVEDSIAIVELYNFNSDSERQFIDAIREFSDKDIRGLILDLRNNPGGYLDKAVSIASAWLDEEQLVVRELFNDTRSTNEYAAIRQFRVPDAPTIVLINGGTASAAEILAGALQDHGKATLVGTTSFGKGSVQDIRSLPDGSGLKITISQWITPNGQYINNVGIEPDVRVESTADDIENGRDPQLQKALELLH